LALCGVTAAASSGTPGLRGVPFGRRSPIKNYPPLSF